LTGTVRVDFCGTKEEHSQFVKDFGHRFPKGLTGGRGGAEIGPNGDHMLSAPFYNLKQLQEVIAAFASFGEDWPQEHQEIRYHNMNAALQPRK